MAGMVSEKFITRKGQGPIASRTGGTLRKVAEWKATKEKERVRVEK